MCTTTPIRRITFLVLLILIGAPSLCFADAWGNPSSADQFRPVKAPLEKLSLKTFAGYTFGTREEERVLTKSERRAIEEKLEKRAQAKREEDLIRAIQNPSYNRTTRVGLTGGGGAWGGKLGEKMKTAYRGFDYALALHGGKTKALYKVVLLGETADQIFERSVSAKKRMSEKDKEKARLFEAKAELLACLSDFRKMYDLETPRIKRAKLGNVLAETYELEKVDGAMRRVRKIEFILPGESARQYAKIVVTDLESEAAEKTAKTAENARGWSL